MAVYVMSDVHGLKDRYDRMLKELPLKDSDVLYVLGDVIDRGPDGILILQDIMSRDNVKMLLGNHEYMMLQYYQVLEDNEVDLYEKMVILDRWQRNHCQVTQAQFNCLPKQEQKEILAFIEDLPLAYGDVEVNGSKYYLVHGCAVPDFHEGCVKAKDLVNTDVTIEDFVWERVEEDRKFFEDRCVILGHTPTLYLQANKPYMIWSANLPIKVAHLINIDCGCAANNAYTQLAVLRLDDRKVFYF